MLLIELRCTCERRGKHPLLGMAGGSDFVVEIKCRFCGRLSTFRYPDPLTTRKKGFDKKIGNGTRGS